MANVMINIKPLLVELSHTDVKALLKGLKNESKILREWNELILELNKIAGKLAKGKNLEMSCIICGVLQKALA